MSHLHTLKGALKVKNTVLVDQINPVCPSHNTLFDWLYEHGNLCIGTL